MLINRVHPDCEVCHELFALSSEDGPRDVSLDVMHTRRLGCGSRLEAGDIVAHGLGSYGRRNLSLLSFSKKLGSRAIRTRPRRSDISVTWGPDAESVSLCVWCVGGRLQ